MKDTDKNDGGNEMINYKKEFSLEAWERGIKRLKKIQDKNPHIDLIRIDGYEIFVNGSFGMTFDAERLFSASFELEKWCEALSNPDNFHEITTIKFK